MADKSSASHSSVFEMDGKPPKSWITPKALTIYGSMHLLITVIILVMAIVSFTGIKDIKNLRYDETKPMTLSGKQAVLEKYPGYFRTPEEQKKIEEGLNISIQANVTDKKQETCNVNTVCPKKLFAMEVNHGCCFSQEHYVAPIEKIDITGVPRVLAQFDGRRQYFKTEDCYQYSSCNGCTCIFGVTYYTGVYVEPSLSCPEYGIAVFAFKSGCKCLNYQ